MWVGSWIYNSRKYISEDIINYPEFLICIIAIMERQINKIGIVQLWLAYTDKKTVQLSKKGGLIGLISLEYGVR